MTRIVVLTGGSTPERDVAFAGAAQVVASLRGLGYEVAVIDTTVGLLEAAAEARALSPAVGREPPAPEVLAELARELNGAVGASRVPCDLGWCPHSMQIGLTGKTVTPELYVAVGISGAGQHMAGCGNARNIIAINTDAEAAIYKDARWGVVGDYRKVVPSLVAAIRAIRSGGRPENS